MKTHAISKMRENKPFLFDGFPMPLMNWFENGLEWAPVMNMPAVNITETKDEYKVAVAIPGMKKEDFNIDVEGNMLTISCEKEETKEEKEKKFTRKEYSYSSFCRNFHLPEEICREDIKANYENGILNIVLPLKEGAKIPAAKHIAVN